MWNSETDDTGYHPKEHQALTLFGETPAWVGLRKCFFKNDSAQCKGPSMGLTGVSSVQTTDVVFFSYLLIRGVMLMK